MVRYTEDAKLANNGLVELSEECQLAINGGCSNSNNANSMDIIRIIFAIADYELRNSY